MQGQMTRPEDPTHIAYPGTPNEMWWSGEEWVKAPVQNVNLDEIVAAFNAIRDARTVKRHAWEEVDAAMEADQQKLKALMLDVLNKTGAKSITTEHGNVYRTEKVRPSAADWNVVYDWIMADSERFELLEKRLKATFVKDFMEANDGAIPPGVNVHREYEVTVRRANSSGNKGKE